MDQLDYYRSFLEDLLGIIRDGADETVQYIFNTVRAGATNGQIRDTLTSIMEDDNEPIARNSDVRESNLNLDITPNNNEGNYFNPPH
ncbi:hypothetical protein PITC_084090 [Penicillium italicum]|uniref:Uncharacterized protein n=1 Tax=Penicillium italicum TaxID=40296 RepID=A0A0A2L627_PENIT|nr:hypothetical protein PITC_084090 [Penicillium italicum]